MEDWEVEFEWLRIRHIVKDSMGKDDLPDFQTMLFLLGVQELGEVRTNYTKEEKQDLMHIAVCTLLEDDGYFEFKGRDGDGWPHWEQKANFKTKGVDDQERLLKEKIITYFKSMETINGGFAN